MLVDKAAQGRGEITISGTVHKTTAPSIQCSSVLDKVVVGHRLDSVILEAFFSLNDCMIKRAKKSIENSLC